MQPDSSARSDEIRGIVLWILVAAALLYGIVNTLSSVIDLFGG
jgi:hypothetical protein